MKALPLLAVATVAAVCFAQDKVKVTPRYEAGARVKWKTELKMNVGGTEAVLAGTIINTVKAVEGDVVRMENDWESPKAIVGGEEMAVPFAPTTYSVNKMGELLEAGGGITGTDVARTLLVAFPHFAKDALGRDESWKVTYNQNDKLEIGERKVEGTYLGEDEVAGEKVHKFKTKMTEGEFMVTLTYWSTADGKVLKMDGEFANLPIPIAGDNATGTLKAEVVK